MTRRECGELPASTRHAATFVAPFQLAQSARAPCETDATRSAGGVVGLPAPLETEGPVAVGG